MFGETGKGSRREIAPMQIFGAVLDSVGSGGSSRIEPRQ
jgi:hypothetical protein